MPRNAEDCLSAVRGLNGGIRLVLEAILADAALAEKVAAGSYSHVNGFDKISLWRWSNAAKCRLHIWWNRFPYSEEIHNHRWDFASAILTGSLHSRFFSPSAGTSWTPTECRTEVDHYAFEPASDPCGLIQTLEMSLSTGDSYALHHDQLHSVHTEVGRPTITAVITAPPLRQTSTVLRRNGFERPSLIPAARMDASAVREKIQAALESLR